MGSDSHHLGLRARSYSSVQQTGRRLSTIVVNCWDKQVVLGVAVCDMSRRALHAFNCTQCRYVDSIVVNGGIQCEVRSVVYIKVQKAV